MIMVTKKIKKDICNSLVGKNIVLWSIVMLLVWAVLLPLHETSQSPMILFIGVIVLVVLIVMSYMYGLKEYHKVTKRIGMVEQFNEERFQTYKHFSLSNQWLVYHKGNEFVPFFRKNIGSIYFDGKNILIDEVDKNGVFVLKSDVKENQIIQDWYHTNG